MSKGENSQTSSPWASQREQLIAASGRTDCRILLRGATILTMDPEIGDLAKGDLLIEGSKIVAIDHDLFESGALGNAIVLDMEGHIILPGMHDTHRHCWQNQFRRLIPDCDDNVAYLDVTHGWLGFHYAPQDIYVGNLISALGCIDAGITSVLDFFHNPRTFEHSVAAVEAFRDAGIRGVHASCGVLAGEWDRAWLGDVEKLQARFFSSSDQLLTLGLGVIAAEFADPIIALSPEKVHFAKSLGIPLISDGVGGQVASDRVEALGRADLLGPDISLIHCLSLSDTGWKMVADSGALVSIPTTSDAQLGLVEAIPAIQKALNHGIRPSLSVDVEVVLGPDMFTQMRTLLIIQRMMVFNRRFNGEANHPLPLRVKDVLEFATLQGARTNRNEHKCGSLTPGKEADLIAIDALDWNTMPLNNAYGTVVSAADSRNIDLVFIAGRVKKLGSEIIGFDREQILQMVTESRDRILGSAGCTLDILEQQFGLLPPSCQSHSH